MTANDIEFADPKDQKKKYELEKPKMPIGPNGKPKSEKDVDSIETMILKGEVDTWCKRNEKLRASLPQAAKIYIGQCIKSIRNRMMEASNWEEVKKDPREVMRLIENILSNYQDNRYPASVIMKAMCDFINFKQGDNEAQAD